MFFAFLSTCFSEFAEVGLKKYKITQETEIEFRFAGHAYIVESKNVKVDGEAAPATPFAVTYSKSLSITIDANAGTEESYITINFLSNSMICDKTYYVYEKAYGLVENLQSYSRSCVVAFGNTENHKFMIRPYYDEITKIKAVSFYPKSGSPYTLVGLTNYSLYSIQGPSAFVYVPTSSNLPNIEIYDSNTYYPTGDYDIRINNTLDITIPPYHVFVAKSTEGITFTDLEDASKMKGQGVYYSKNEELKITIQKTTSTTVYFGVARINKTWECSDISALILTDEYSGFNNKDLSDSTHCYVITSSNTYQYLFSQQGLDSSSSVKRIYIIDSFGNTYNKFVTREDERLAVYGQTITLMISPGTSSTATFGLVSAQIWGKHPVTDTRVSKFFMIEGTTTEPRNTHTFTGVGNQKIIPRQFYQIYIPDGGRTLTFYKDDLVVFHNPKYFEGTYTYNGQSTNILSSTQKYVFNITSNGIVFNIKPKSGSSVRVLNMTVDYGYYYITPFVDVIVLAPGDFIYLLVHEEKKYMGYETNLTLKEKTRLTQHIYSTNRFTISLYNDGDSAWQTTSPYNPRTVSSADTDTHKLYCRVTIWSKNSLNANGGTLVKLQAESYDTDSEEISGFYAGASSFTGAKYVKNKPDRINTVVQVGNDIAQQYDGSLDGSLEKEKKIAKKVIIIIVVIVILIILLPIIIIICCCCYCTTRSAARCLCCVKTASSSSSSSSSTSTSSLFKKKQASSPPPGYGYQAPPPQGYPPQGYPPQGYPPQQGYPQGGYPPPPPPSQGGYPPGGYPPPPPPAQGDPPPQ